MEPLAPGTEDDVLHLPTVSKKANEQERLLQVKAWLPDNTFNNVFELTYNNGSEHWYCRLCECPIMGRVFYHESGKRHSINMTNATNQQRKQEENENNQTQKASDLPTIRVAPGEPVPPGFEGEITKVAQIQERLNNFHSGSLLGLEYLLEIQDYDQEKEPSYLCLLCGKKGDPRTVIAHLVSYNHLQGYMQRHFPKTYQALAPFVTRQYKKNWQDTMNKIAEAIETKYGRLLPHPVEAHVFERKKEKLYQMVHAGPHFSEKNGITFEHLILKEDITKVSEEELVAAPAREEKPLIPAKKRDPSPPVVRKPKKPISLRGQGVRRSLSSVSSISSNDMSDIEEKQQKRYEKARYEKRRRSRSPKVRESRTYVRSPARRARGFGRGRGRGRGVFRPGGYTGPDKKDSGGYTGPDKRDSGGYTGPDKRAPGGYTGPDKRDKLPWQRSEYTRPYPTSSASREKEKEKDKLQKFDEFKKLSTAIENDMDKVLKQHMNNPEKHPQYNDEWKIFWNKRYKELQAEGKDASKYDFKPEWIIYWNEKISNLHKSEVKNKIEALRKRLGLPTIVVNDPTPVSFKIGTNSKKKPEGEPVKDNKKPVPMAAEPDQDHEVIIIEDIPEETKSPKRKRSPPPSRRSPVRKNISRDRSISPRQQRRKKSPQIVINRNRSPITRNRSRSRNLSPGRSHSPWETEIPARTVAAPRKISKERLSRERERRMSLDRVSSGERDLSPIKPRARYSRDPYSRDRSRERRDEYRGRDFHSREKSWERAINHHREVRKDSHECYKPPPIMRDVTRKPVDYHQKSELEDDGDINIVVVLRLLTALEDRLGSLGPKIIDMLATALALEKKQANSAENLLDNEINCVLFETVKEKLKGQLHAGLVGYAQEKAFKIAVQKIAAVLHVAGERKKELDSKPKVDPVKVPGVGTVDKAAIAKQIATALILQGKTDVTQAELEQLINAVVGMAEASKNSDKPMTTASFLLQLAEGRAEPATPAPLVVVKPVPVVTPEPIRSTPTPVEIPAPVVEAPKNAMDGLSDSDLQTLLQNFKDLSTEEQHGLITYLKKMEAKEPSRVEKLRKFVNLGHQEEPKQTVVVAKVEPPAEVPKKETGRISPFSFKLKQEAEVVREKPKPIVEAEYEEFEDDPKSEEDEKVEEPPKEKEKIKIDSDDEDYSYEDVFKAANKNVEDKKLEKERQFVEDTLKREKPRNKGGEINLNDAKALIANIMGSISSKLSPQTIKSSENSSEGNDSPGVNKFAQFGGQQSGMHGNQSMGQFSKQGAQITSFLQANANKPVQQGQNNQMMAQQHYQMDSNAPNQNQMNYSRSFGGQGNPRMQPQNPQFQNPQFQNPQVRPQAYQSFSQYPNTNNQDQQFGGNFQNQNSQSFGNNSNNFNLNPSNRNFAPGPNQFEPNRFIEPNPRGNFNNPNRGGMNYNNRWSFQ